MQAQDAAAAALEASEEHIASLNDRVAEEQSKTAAIQMELNQVWPCSLTNKQPSCLSHGASAVFIEG